MTFARRPSRLSRLSGLLDAVYNGCLYCAGALLCALCVLVLYSIAARLFGFFAGGATDVAGYLMAAATFLALAPTFRANGHIFVSLLTSRLPPRRQRALSLAAHAVMAAATLYLAFYMTRLAYFSFQFKERSEGADAILLWIPQAPAAFGAALFAVCVLHCGAEVWARRRPPAPAAPAPAAQPATQPPPPPPPQKAP